MKKRKPISTKKRKRVLPILWEEQNRCCWYCSRFTPKQWATIDHLNPRSNGGDHSLDNIVVACQWCNCKRGTKDPVEYRKLMLLAVESESGYIGPVWYMDLREIKNERRKKRRKKPKPWWRQPTRYYKKVSFN